MIQFPTLYSHDSKMKLREWSISAHDDEVITTHGLSDGKKTTKSYKAKPKNVGKSNEKSAEVQAMLEAVSRWKKHIQREDYHWNPNLANNQLRPMLALDYLKVPHRVDWHDAVAQPKLDGARALAGYRYADGRSDKFELMTRKGEVWMLPFIHGEAEWLLETVNSILPGGYKCLAIDGEIYCPGMSLQNIMSLAKKYRPGESEQLEYHVFDLVIPGMPFRTRYEALWVALNEYPPKGVLNIVPCEEVDEESIDRVLGECIELGFEGVMIRDGNSEYTCSRSPSLFKYKKFLDDEFLITNVWADHWGHAMFSCQTAEGKDFDCTPKRTHKERKQILQEKEKYIGEMLTVKYQDLTDEGIPTFPVGLQVRDSHEI